ncbi:MAG TPA: hypothetical protein VNA24_03715 [Hyalangium sp.]|nr:hypothetical protein [Hyalangium sp.]
MASRAVEHFSEACSALEAGDLDSAARNLRALRMEHPDLPEARLLESLLKLRRDRPSLGGLDAFIQAWNDAGRPDFSESRLLPAEFFPKSAEAQAEKPRTFSPEVELLLATSQPPELRHGHLVLQHLHELEPPEWVFAADDLLRSESLPQELRTQGAQTLRARLSALTIASPQAMQYPALLLVLDSSPETPFSSEELQALEAIAALSDWRETEFHTLFHHALDQLQAAQHSEPAHTAFMFAVSALASRPALLLFKRAEASREVLPAEQLHRLGEALWRIGSRMAKESTLLERLLGTRLMEEGAELTRDKVRAQHVSLMRETARQAAEAMRQAVPERWPLRSLYAAHMEAKMRDEMGCMLRFLPPTPVPPDMP